MLNGTGEPALPILIVPSEFVPILIVILLRTIPVLILIPLIPVPVCSHDCTSTRGSHFTARWPTISSVHDSPNAQISKSESHWHQALIEVSRILFFTRVKRSNGGRLGCTGLFRCFGIGGRGARLQVYAPPPGKQSAGP